MPIHVDADRFNKRAETNPFVPQSASTFGEPRPVTLTYRSMRSWESEPRPTFC
jgi:hypothetical protein